MCRKFVSGSIVTTSEAMTLTVNIHVSLPRYCGVCTVCQDEPVAYSRASTCFVASWWKRDLATHSRWSPNFVTCMEETEGKWVFGSGSLTNMDVSECNFIDLAELLTLSKNHRKKTFYRLKHAATTAPSDQTKVGLLLVEISATDTYRTIFKWKLHEQGDAWSYCKHVLPVNLQLYISRLSYDQR